MKKNKFIINTTNKLKKLATFVAVVGILNGAQLAATPKDKTEEKFVEQKLTMRSAEELAEIDTLQQKADDARNFNSLSEKWQRDLINIKAKAIVAQEQGNEVAYQKYKNEFDSKFKDYVEENQYFDDINKMADDDTTLRDVYYEKKKLIETITGKGTGYRGFGMTEEQAQTKLKMNFGGEVVNGEFVRDNNGRLKMEVPEVPQKNFIERGYQQQTDGTWLYENKFFTRVVTDVNKNGFFDAGDTYKESFGISSPTFLSADYDEKEVAYVEREQIDPNYNAKTELEIAIARERTRLKLQRKKQGREKY